MDEARRRALEAEFDEKSAELSGMMGQVDEVQRAYARLALALRARAVKEKENAAREETVEMERMLARCQQAKSDLDAAKAAGDAQRVAACEAVCEAEKLSFELAQRHERDACRRQWREQAGGASELQRSSLLRLLQFPDRSESPLAGHWGRAPNSKCPIALENLFLKCLESV